MGALTGALDKRVTFRRRETLAVPVAGNDRGDFVDWFTCWAWYSPINLSQDVEGGQQVGVATGLLTVRDGGNVKDVTTAERVMIAGTEFSILRQDVPDRSGYTTFRVQSTLGG